MRFTTISAFLAVAALSGAATAASVTDNFELGTNQGGWSYGCTPCESVEGNGGNPFGNLHTVGLDTFAPNLRTANGAGNPYHGDYRARNVESFKLDLITNSATFGAGGRPLTLMLIHDNGTPGNPLDDTAAYSLDEAVNIPLPGEGWKSYTFDIPSKETTLPAGWVLLNLGDSGAPAIHSWDTVIQDVNRVQFYYGNPELFFIFQQWDLRADNIGLIEGEPAGCPEDVDGSGIVDTDDLLAVINGWGTDGSANNSDVNDDGVVDSDDILAVINAWGICNPI